MNAYVYKGTCSYLSPYLVYFVSTVCCFCNGNVRFHLSFAFHHLIIYPAVPCSGVDDDTEQTGGGR